MHRYFTTAIADVRPMRLSRCGATWRLAVALALTAPVVASASAQPTAETGIRLEFATRIDGMVAPFFLAQDSGDYKAEGLRVTLAPVPNNGDVFDRLTAGTADLAVADPSTLIRYRAAKPASDLRLIYIVYDKPTYAIVTRKSRGITAPKDLGGKTLAAPRTEVTGALWPLFAKNAGIDASKVTVESVSRLVREPMLASGQVDAISGNAVNSFLDLKDRGVPESDIVVWPMSRYGIDSYGYAVVASEKFLKNNPQAAEAFLRALSKAMRTSNHSPGRAIDSLARHVEDVQRPVELDRLRMTIGTLLRDSEIRTDGLGTIRSERMQAAITQISDAFGLKSKLTPDAIFDRSFLPPQSQRRID